MMPPWAILWAGESEKRSAGTIWILLCLTGCSIGTRPNLIQSESMVHKFLKDQWTVQEVEDRYEKSREETRELIKLLRDVRKRNRQLYRDLQGDLEYHTTLQRRRAEIARLRQESKGLESIKKKLAQQVARLRSEVARLRKETGELEKTRAEQKVKPPEKSVGGGGG